MREDLTRAFGSGAMVLLPLSSANRPTVSQSLAGKSPVHDMAGHFAIGIPQSALRLPSKRRDPIRSFANRSTYHAHSSTFFVHYLPASPLV